jgi:methyl-accepting chemotaxis protein
MTYNLNNATEKGKPFQRRIILIKKGIQLRYMALIFASVIVGFLIVGLELVWSFSRVFAERPMLLQPLFSELGPMVPLIAIKLVIYLVIVLIVSGVISHRLAGPVFKIEKTCGEIGKGDLSRKVCLRKGDQMVDLKDAVNGMTDSLEKLVDLEREKALSLQNRLGQIASACGDEKLKKELETAAEEAGSINSVFKTGKARRGSEPGVL